jgi:hypothetical protein
MEMEDYDDMEEFLLDDVVVVELEVWTTVFELLLEEGLTGD